MTTETTAKESNFCGECGRRKKIACTCGMTFAEKIKRQNLNYGNLRNH